MFGSEGSRVKLCYKPHKKSSEHKMYADTTPMNPVSFAMASVGAYIRDETKEEPQDLADMFKTYGKLCFRNGFIVGFVAGASAAALAVMRFRT